MILTTFYRIMNNCPLNTNYFVQDDTHPLSDLNNKKKSLCLTGTSISLRLKKYQSEDIINKRASLNFNPLKTRGPQNLEMSILSDNLYLENIEEYIQDENRIVR